MFVDDIYQPVQWHDYFVMVGGGSAALTGLVFIALSLNTYAVKVNTAHRWRATGSLMGLGAVFLVSALVLMGDQGHRAVGSEVLVVSGFAYLFYAIGVIQSRRPGSSDEPLSLRLQIGTSICYLLEVSGAIVFIIGNIAGLYMICVAIAASVCFFLTAAWRLFVGLAMARPESEPLPERGP